MFQRLHCDEYICYAIKSYVQKNVIIFKNISGNVASFGKKCWEI